MGQQREAIVVFNGCFCPVHTGHVAALEEAKRRVESGGDVKVVAGYFAVATDGYVKGKLGHKLHPWMTAAARTEMCKAVAQDAGWNISAAVSPGALQLGHTMVAANHRRTAQHKAPTEIYSVRKLVQCEQLREQGKGTDHKMLSSTKIRAHLEHGGYSPEAVSELVDQRLLLPAVGRCLQQHLGQSIAEPKCEVRSTDAAAANGSTASTTDSAAQANNSSLMAAASSSTSSFAAPPMEKLEIPG
mmetsp:Transcript_69720/g.145372  ORF Transcript_69720/g.145372 Transcript_69720/m.145372 type:complete len:244 (-) Transcript_69720:125-856(-)|eukprot:CAMPEP_0181313640 /NCGR_PEP_ID=MMETSP1101-20121128/14361_1 /TAXON_ID=46948 /ORGANISM="Rhodomonas abbreviata, Strain Caron Lab Isolate" /LENGTH=243 /DNA_ID=CAMNT_0023420617 /DNA_START=78 /DNA_END=809 /DNA_ORIENTATION=+